MKRDRSAYFFILPAFLFASVFVFIPLGQGLWLSLFKAGLRSREFVGLRNFARMFTDPMFWSQIKNTLILVVGYVSLSLIMTLSLALAIHRLRNSLQSFFRFAFYLPGICAGAVTAMVWIWMFNPTYGLLNYALSWFGLGPIYWLSEAVTARLAIIMMLSVWSLGGSIILFLAALNAVPEHLYEAAKIDGANATQRFFHVTVPLIMPMTVYVMITLTIGGFQIWEAIYMLTAGGPVRATVNIVYRLYQLGFGYYKFGQASAYGVFLLCILFPTAFFQFKYLSKKLEF